MRRMMIAATVALFVTGCGGSGQPTTGDLSKRITWAEYQRMDAEQKDDPYVVDNLDADAKQKLAQQQKKKR